MAIKKKTKRKIAGKTSPKKRTPGWVMLLGGIGIGLLMSVLGYMNDWVPKPDNPNKPIAQTAEIIKKNTIEDKSADLKIEPRKNFDFYETLQDMEVVIDEDLKQTDNRIAKKYILQLGSFKDQDDAEVLKAKVAFIGLTANIQNVNVNGTNWHRVRVGPYESGRKSDKVFKNLKSNGFKAIILREK